MTAKFRVAIAVLLTVLVLGPAAVLAQNVPPPAGESTGNQVNSSDQVGPRALENFNLPGKVTRRGETQPTPPAQRPPPVTRPTRPAPTTTAPTSTPQPRTEPKVTPPIAAKEKARPTRTEAVTKSQSDPIGRAQPESTGPSVTVKLPPVSDFPTDSSGVAAPAAASSGAPSNGVPLPWLLASVLLLGGAGWYFWSGRRRSVAFAGAAESAAYRQPEPMPDPPKVEPAIVSRREVPVQAPRADPVGLVSTRMRPRLEIAFRPTSCRIDDNEVAFEFELGLFNSGSVPARAILVEAQYFNAGDDQSQQIERFFANPIGEGGRAVSLAPLKNLVVRTKVVTPRSQIREYEAGGRRVFVPLIGFNALYRWSSGEGQTSVSYMLGRSTQTDKLAPFRLDQIGREFRDLDGRLLPVALRL